MRGGRSADNGKIGTAERFRGLFIQLRSKEQKMTEVNKAVKRILK
jgi:hypothetical protein